MDERFETVFRTKNPIEGDTLLEILTTEGLRARMLGMRDAALIGVGASLIDLRIEVPASDVERARELIDAFHHAEPADDRDPAVREPSTPAPLAPRRATIAVGAAFVCPGGGHLYARRPWTALVLALGLAGAFVVLVGGHNVASTCAALVFGGLVLADALGGRRAVDAANRGTRIPVGLQLRNGLAMVIVTAAIGTVIGANLPPPKRHAISRFHGNAED